MPSLRRTNRRRKDTTNVTNETAVVRNETTKVTNEIFSFVPKMVSKGKNRFRIEQIWFPLEGSSSV